MTTAVIRVSTVDPNKELLLAIQENNWRLVKQLLKDPGVKLNSFDFLYFAVRYKRGYIVEKLIASGTKIDKFAKDGKFTPLMKAVTDDSLLIAELLLNAGADPDLPCLAVSQTPFFYATSYDMYALLARKGADANYADSTGTSPLIHALHNDRSIACIEVLVYAGADVNYTTPAGLTALTLAVQKELNSVVKLLLERGGNIYTRTPEGKRLRELTNSASLHNILRRTEAYQKQTTAIQEQMHNNLFGNDCIGALWNTAYDSVSHFFTVLLGQIALSSAEVIET